MRAQFVPPATCPEIYPPLPPEAVGQWQGPYPTNIDESGTYAYPKTREIVHMALLPPPAGQPAYARVLISALTGHGCFAPVNDECELNTTGQQYGRSSYLLLGSTPSTAGAIPPPVTLPLDGSQDLFCGGHAFLPDGSLLWAGGSDYKQACLECASGGFVGHKYAYRLDTSVHPPVWSAAAHMSLDRWYPTLVAYGHEAAKVGAFGHTSKPINYSEYYREELDFAGLLWNVDPILNEIGQAGCTTPGDLYIYDYPRMHVLRSGLLLHGNPIRPAQPSAPKPYEWQALKAQFLDFEDPFCPAEPRWYERPGTGQFPFATPEVPRLHGNSVILLGHDGEEHVEVVYGLAGSFTEVAGNPCHCHATPASWQSEAVYLKSVEKMVTFDNRPDTIQQAGWDPSPPDLKYSRVNHNTVIALDGRIVVFGGTSFEDGECVSRKVVEAYAPPEIFGNPNAVWECWAEQGLERGYHSVAVLLPDGRIISGGGRALPHPDDPAVDPNCVPAEPDPRWMKPAHTVEIFSPPYMFVPRPVIDKATIPDPVPEAQEYDDFFTFEVDLVHPDDTIARVALVRNGSSTHAFDSDQGYVQVPIDQILTDPERPRRRIVRVLMPPDAHHAPQGFYMLTVVDQNQIPSAAEWIRLEAP